MRVLLRALRRLQGDGHSIIAIEHNLDFIREADWVVDLGPEGGEGGGRVVACGTVQQVARTPGSITGSYLRHMLGEAERAAPRRRG